MDYEDEDYNEEEDYNEYEDEYEDEYEKEDNIEMKGEVNAFERTGIRNDFNMLDVENLDKKSKLKKTPLERFYESVNGICQQLLERNKLVEGDIRIILENIGQLDKPEYKNATAYILGYLTFKDSNKDGTINKKFLDNLEKKVLPTLEDRSVTIPDVIRYTRLWMNLEGVEK